MSLEGFKEFYLESVLSFLWRQWSALGVLGEARAEDPWVVDPEALLLFTLPFARHEPRLFDEVMDWLCVNGDRLDGQRLRGILRKKDAATHCLLGAILKAPREGGREDRKWSGLIRYCEGFIEKNAKPAALFLKKDGTGIDFKGKQGNVAFEAFGFRRGDLEIRRLSRRVVPSARMTLRFLLRGLLGIGSRSECILYLLTNDGGHPSEIAEAIGVTLLAAQQTLSELSSSGLVLTRSRGGRRLEYWISQPRWWEFLSGASGESFSPPRYVNWIALFSALEGVWGALAAIEAESSEYLRSSRLRDAFEKVGNEFMKSGLAIPKLPGADVRPEAYEEAVKRFMTTILGAERWDR